MQRHQRHCAEDKNGSDAHRHGRVPYPQQDCHDVPRGRETNEVVVAGLGGFVGIAEHRRHQDQNNQGNRQRPWPQWQIHNHESRGYGGPGEIVDDVVHHCAVKPRDDFLDVMLTRHIAVDTIDDEGNAQPEPHPMWAALQQCDRSQRCPHQTGQREGMHSPGDDMLAPGEAGEGRGGAGSIGAGSIWPTGGTRTGIVGASSSVHGRCPLENKMRTTANLYRSCAQSRFFSIGEYNGRWVVFPYFYSGLFRVI